MLRCPRPDDGQRQAAHRVLSVSSLYPGDAPSRRRFDVTVPPGKLWLLGDHRSVAYDSQITGPLAVQVVGRVFCILRSGRIISLHTPQTFIAGGLAPAHKSLPPAAIGMALFVLGLLALLAPVMIGIVRQALRARRRRPPVQSAPSPSPVQASVPARDCWPIARVARPPGTERTAMTVGVQDELRRIVARLAPSHELADRRRSARTGMPRRPAAG
jgi:hypothetical protein